MTRYALSEADFDALAGGGGTTAALRRIREGERSHRFLLLDLFLDRVTGDPDVLGPLPPADSAWRLLLAANRQDRSKAEDLLLAPEAGLWIAATLRRLGGAADAAQPDVPLWVDVGQLHCFAAAAAVRAGVDFTLTVPVRHGTVWLPSLGRAVAPGAVRPWGTARVTCRAGDLTIRIADRIIGVPAPHAEETPEWQPVRTVTVPVLDRRFEILLDDLSAHRIDPEAAGPPLSRLTSAEAEQWAALLRDAVALLGETDAQSAVDVVTLLRSIEPLSSPDSAALVSATSGDGVGRLASSRSPDALQMAAVLTHEIQHSKLGALMHLYSLYEPGDTTLSYAPWRDDPRPLRGLLQGTYAFTGVARFWRARARHARGDGQDVDPAHFEYVLRRQQLLTVLPQLCDHPGLTELGRRTARRLRETVLGWAEPDAEPDRLAAVRTMAEDAAEHHALSWRLHHLAADPALAMALTRAWPRPPGAALPDARSQLRPRPGVRRLDTLASLYRIRLRDEWALERVGDDPAGLSRLVAGAQVPGLLQVRGDSEGAGKLAATALQTGEPDAESLWADLLLALRASGHEAVGPAVLARPELTHAVYREIGWADGAAPDPVSFVGWLNDHLSTAFGTPGSGAAAVGLR
ncbi:HEXXH motif domain-containing protein [Streptomyces sp. B93]|uniref:HEXXH motif domain-containing protein n=1 Tax=Streptomyces sp. B93 TaxID=2824875 RepID=UPI001B380202|nr:HEXXH motif domain-containing protein [Streptomyces sp. B93]MBQ1090756.1 hypothetical protein [Streptomyces sp. B93]